MRLFLPILLLAVVGTAALAEDTKIFIAPSGEPFRVGGDQPYPVQKWFAGADKNGDGKLDYAEFEADFMRFIAELDVNHDGAIDGVERTRYESEVAPETLGGEWAAAARDAQDEADREVDFGGNDQGASTIKRDKPKYGKNPIGAARFDLLGLPEPVAAMDTELRGRISERAVRAAARLRFDVLDGQHLGYLTLATLPPSYAEGRNSATGKLRMSHDRGDNTRGH